ncbi:glycosyl hydrolase family 3 n terminal domain-containing [Fusarium acutatum]|uniref:Beta-glucosidase cel3A n=1 Tax=Fusarium acutatum TaxID=78861 RepID=A0A8H4JGL3_9HYPO|nr:glycosyl hydrolase family 3 n terminal domain-containing [Fusarium acutatum]
MWQATAAVVPFLCQLAQATNQWPGSKQWDSAQMQAEAFMAQLTLDEKVGMVTGASFDIGTGCLGTIAPIERINFPGWCLADGPNGVARADLVSTFPSGVTIAASWDRQLMGERGYAIGREFRDKGMHILLGPVAGPLGRRPLGGRNWEGFSPDPYLTGVAMDLTIRATQKAGVQTVAKHFIGNEQETQRTRSNIGGKVVEGISSNLDDRTLHELYLWPFADSVRAGTSSIMCSYNRYNQTYACENSRLLSGILKKELGFRGYVMSDWYATHSTSKSANAGLDMEMPGQLSTQGGATWWGPNLTSAVEAGKVSQERLNDMVRRVTTPYFLIKQDKSFPTLDPSTLPLFLSDAGLPPILQNITEVRARDVRSNHGDLIRRIGAESTVLLKNEANILPLKAKNIGVFGNDAADWTDGMALPATPGDVEIAKRKPEWGFDMGTLDIGGGAGGTRHTKIVSPLQGIRDRAKVVGARVQYILNNDVLAANNFRGIYPTPDVCIVFIKTYSVENRDRASFEADWNSTVVVNNVANRCPNTVVVTHSSGVNTFPWANHKNVKAILAAHYPGEQSGNSIADVLWGRVNPSAKLPYTIPVNASDYNSPVILAPRDPSPTGWQDDFYDGLFIDYRLFDKRGIRPLYEFGFGLSYTTFAITGDLSIKQLVANPAASVGPTEKAGRKENLALGGNPQLWHPLLRTTVKVTNTGKVPGATVVQLYLAFPSHSTPRGTPKQVLRGFEKIYLLPGETRRVAFESTRRDVSYWDTETQSWRVPAGQVEVRVGFSSRDIQATAKHSLL